MDDLCADAGARPKRIAFDQLSSRIPGPSKGKTDEPRGNLAREGHGSRDVCVCCYGIFSLAHETWQLALVRTRVLFVLPNSAAPNLNIEHK